MVVVVVMLVVVVVVVMVVRVFVPILVLQELIVVLVLVVRVVSEPGLVPRSTQALSKYVPTPTRKSNDTRVKSLGLAGTMSKHR